MNESLVSQLAHQKGIALLVNSHFLRKNGCGQVDVAVLSCHNNLWIGEIIEVKSSRYPSYGQILRLRNSQTLLSHVLEMPFKLTLSVSLPKVRSAD